MKTLDFHAHPNLLRRRLMLVVPSGLALVSPLGLVACGGGGGEGAATPAAGGATPLREAGRAFAGTEAFTESPVTVEIPPGVVLPEGGTALYTPLGGFSEVAAGRATLRHLFGSAQLATLFSAEGLPLLYGFVGPGMPALSAHSTATALIAFSMGAEWTSGSANAAWLAQIHASPAAASLAQSISAALAADVYALAQADATITDAVIAAVRSLTASYSASSAVGRERAQGIAINPASAASGLQPIVGDVLNTTFVQNEKLRRAWYVIRREGHTDSAGAMISDSARPVIASGDIPMLPGFDSAGAIFGAVGEAYYSGDNSKLAFSRTPEAALPVTPEGAKRTQYSVTVLTAGNAALSYSADAYAKLDESERRKIDISLFATENLALQALVMDLLVPLFVSWIGGKIGDETKNLGARDLKERMQASLFGALLGVLTTNVPAIVAKLRNAKDNPDYGIVGALSDIVRSQLIDTVEVPVPGRAKALTVPVLSKFSIGFLTLLLKWFIYEKMPYDQGEALLAFLDGDANNRGENLYEWTPKPGKDGKDPKPIQFNKENLAFAGMGVATKCLALVDSGLFLLAKSRLTADIATSRLIESWQVNATKAKVVLRPDPLEVETTGVTYPVTAEIVDNDNDEFGVEKGSIVFDWECTGQYGNLYSRADASLSQPNRFTTSKNYATTDYLPNGKAADAAPETIKVTAYFEPIGAGGARELIGTATSTLKFKKAFSLKITPVTTELPTDARLGVNAALVETLPTTASVRYEWRLRSGGGDLNISSADTDKAHSYVDYIAPATETTAVVEVVAVVTVDQALPPTRTDPVTTTIQVKKGLKTLTLRGGWTYEITYRPWTIDGRTYFTAYDVVAYVVVPKVSGATGYSVLLEKPTPDVPRGVPFPHTRTLTPSTGLAGWEDRGGAWWSGLSGSSGSSTEGGAVAGSVGWMVGRFSDMTVTVTVTLPQ